MYTKWKTHDFYFHFEQSKQKHSCVITVEILLFVFESKKLARLHF